MKEMTKKELQQDRDDWKSIAELNTDIIDELRARNSELSAKLLRFQSPVVKEVL